VVPDGFDFVLDTPFTDMRGWALTGAVFTVMLIWLGLVFLDF